MAIPRAVPKRRDSTDRLLRLLLSKLCYLERESRDNKTVKIADFLITKEIAMEYMKKRYSDYHMRPSRWKDIKVSVHI